MIWMVSNRSDGGIVGHLVFFGGLAVFKGGFRVSPACPQENDRC